jgi:hypothetical protein
MSARSTIGGLALAFALSGCAYPVATVEQGAASSGLYFPGAPVGATVSIDGVGAGEAATFDGRKVLLTIATGSHRVRVESAGAVLYDQSVYIGPGARLAIKVH